MSELELAMELAYRAHSGVTRKDSVLPYITHPMSVLKILSQWGVEDEDILSASICHDVLEDAPSYQEELRGTLSSRAFGFVEELTTPEGQSSKEKILYFKKFRSTSIESLIIKMADRLDNIWDFKKTRVEYASTYAMRGLYIFQNYCDRKGELSIELQHLIGQAIYNMESAVFPLCPFVLGKKSDENFFLEELGIGND